MKAKKISENVVEIDGIRYIKEKSNWLDIPELGISVELNVHDKKTSWDDLGLKNRESELLTVEECIFLANSKYAKQLKMDGSSTKDDFFVQQPFKLNKKNGYVARFYSYSGWSYFVCVEVADYCNGALGVRFKKKLSKKSS